MADQKLDGETGHRPGSGAGQVESCQRHPGECSLVDALPPEVKERCQKNPHLLQYLHTLPTREGGIPQYYAKVDRKMSTQKYRNLLYPVSESTVVHIWTVTGEERDLYIPVEPSYGMVLEEALAKVEEQLLERAREFAEAKTRAEREQGILATLESICEVGAGGRNTPEKKRKNGKRGGGRVRVTAQEFEAVKYLVLREKVGLGLLEPMVQDKHIEDISCSGLGNVFLEHKIFQSMKSSLTFDTHEKLDRFIMRLSEMIKRPVTMRNPIVDAVLPDGSRINIVYGRDVSPRGSNFTIRKFSDTPLSIMELIEFGTMSYRMAAYLSLVLEDGMSLFVCGETASGKTTLINAITVFVPPSAKVVSIEDTPEVQVPHGNWLREVAKAPRAGEKGAAVTMMDLLKAALRQRPNLIIIGEIRGEEGAIAFQAMQTGHAVMATFHASSVEKLIQRLTGHPINIPKIYLDNLNVVVIQSAVKLPSGKLGRRATSINEIVGYDPVANSFSFVEVFRWDPAKDVFDFPGHKNSYLLEEKIAFKRGLPPLKRWDIYTILERRAKVLERLHKERGVTGYYEVQKVLAQAHREGIF